MITFWDALLIFLVWLGVHTARERFSEWFTEPRIGWRLMPFIPSLICVPCMFVPGPWLENAGSVTWPMRVLFGAMLCVVAYNFGGIAKRLGLADVVNAAGVEAIVKKTTPIKGEKQP